MENNLKKNIYVCVCVCVCVYIYIKTESLCCTPKTNSTLSINYTSIKKKKKKTLRPKTSQEATPEPRLEMSVGSSNGGDKEEVYLESIDV